MTRELRSARRCETAARPSWHLRYDKEAELKEACLLRLSSLPTVHLRVQQLVNYQSGSTSSTHRHHSARILASPYPKTLQSAKPSDIKSPRNFPLPSIKESMCLIKIRRDEEEDYVPSRRVVRVKRERERIRSASPRRSSRIIVAAVPPPPEPVRSSRGYALPPPQPVPVFVEPPPPSPAPAETHYVHVSPRSSLSDRREDDYTYRREVRREYSPARSSRGDDFYEYRHIEGPRRSSRSRSRSRRRVEDEYDDDRRETVRVSSRVYRD